ncbi:MAG: 1-deoxy-D-xylulose-5-phosphate synthase [Desulfovibrionaceae bacterium]|nr:1-deoxy-D-xylulose-5-phosphate synthase [Desulfovibrionaceae bacterium]
MNTSPSPSAPILASLKHPAEITDLTNEQKKALAAELRDVIIHRVSVNGGHLAPSLGVIELTLSLLSVFNPEKDKVVWDVGHQAYAWKLLTGRYRAFETLRKLGGLSGFPKIAESPYDHFGVGHSSTAISAALGMAMARDLEGKENHVIAVVGDGAFASGLSFEALNQAGDMRRRLIVVLNDNEMAIAPNVGAISLFMSRNMETGWARKIRRDLKEWLKSIPGIGDDIVNYARHAQRNLKTIFTPGMLIEALNFKYIGPVDGHNIEDLERHLRLAATFDRPVLLHVLTKKGKGYAPAEANPTKYHGLGRFDIATGTPEATPPGTPPSYTSIFSSTLCRMGAEDRRIVAITAAMPGGTGTARFKKLFPDRFVDVGISEEHAATFAAGLATQGFRPFVAIYSTFTQRSYDEIIHDICLQDLPVTFCIDRAGLVGEDGATHHGVFDMSFLRCVPNMHILAPGNGKDLERALVTALNLNHPVAVRYPRGSVPAGSPLPDESSSILSIPPFPLGEGVLLRDGRDALILAAGSMVHPSLEAAAMLQREGIETAVFDTRWIHPLPADQIAELARRFSRILIAEEHVLAGGFSSAVLECLSDRNLMEHLKIVRAGIQDAFVEHGPQKTLRHLAGLDAEGIASALRTLL